MSLMARKSGHLSDIMSCPGEQRVNHQCHFVRSSTAKSPCARRSCLCSAPAPYDVETLSALPTTLSYRAARRPHTTPSCRGSSRRQECVDAPALMSATEVRHVSFATQFSSSPVQPGPPKRHRRSLIMPTAAILAADAMFGQKCDNGTVDISEFCDILPSLAANFAKSRRSSKIAGKQECQQLEGLPPHTTSASSETCRRNSKKRRTLRTPRVERFQKLEARATIKVAQKRHAEEQVIRKKQFQEMRASDVDVLTHTFTRLDNGSGQLSPENAVICLRALSLSGDNDEERDDVFEIITELALEQAPSSATIVGGRIHITATLTLYDFAVLVPKVRYRLSEIRITRMLKRLWSPDADKNGLLTPAQCGDLARSMGIDKRIFWAVAADMGEETIFNFEALQVILTKSREKANQVIREREQQIIDGAAVTKSVIQELQYDIITLHSIFIKYDDRGRGPRRHIEIIMMMMEFGLTFHQGLLDAVEEEGYNQIHLKTFLQIVCSVRQFMREVSKDDELKIFARYDWDRSGNLSVNEVSELLADVGLAPRNRLEQEELAFMIVSVDKDGSGCISFEEFQILCQRVSEKLKRMRYKAEVDVAVDLGFTESHLRDFRFAFDSLDTQGIGKVNPDKVHAAYSALCSPISRDTVDMALQKVVQTTEGGIDFVEFIGFMKHMRNTIHGTTLSTKQLASEVQHLDVGILRRVALQCFHLSESYATALTRDELLVLFCDYTQTSPNTDLHEKFGISTESELYTFARTHDALVNSG